MEHLPSRVANVRRIDAFDATLREHAVAAAAAARAGQGEGAAEGTPATAAPVVLALLLTDKYETAPLWKALAHERRGGAVALAEVRRRRSIGVARGSSLFVARGAAAARDRTLRKAAQVRSG